MKNFFLLVLMLTMSAVVPQSCQKTASVNVPPQVDRTSDLAVSDRTCSECELEIFVEVADWDDVSSIVVYYPDPADPFGTPLVKVFTSATPQSYSICAAPGDFYVAIVGGPAAFYAEPVSCYDTNKVFYFVNSGSGSVNCTVTYNGCDMNSCWSLNGCGGLSQ